jgi:hypothetical protein
MIEMTVPEQRSDLFMVCYKRFKFFRLTVPPYKPTVSTYKMPLVNPHFSPMRLVSQGRE